MKHPKIAEYVVNLMSAYDPKRTMSPLLKSSLWVSNSDVIVRREVAAISVGATSCEQAVLKSRLSNLDDRTGLMIRLILVAAVFAALCNNYVDSALARGSDMKMFDADGTFAWPDDDEFTSPPDCAGPH